MSSLMATFGINDLTSSERLQLVHEILDSLAPDLETPEPTASQRAELDRRIAALDSNPSAVSPWEQVEARILSKIQP